jgi:YegS/Rv2252/BmrU family lipid kinase
MAQRTLLIIRNPRARHAASEVALLAASEPLLAAGWQVDVQTSTGPGDASELASAAAAEGIAVVAAAGGDGTVHEVVNGLAGSGTALAVIPCGTANVWARESGVPRDLGRAIAALASARRVRVDLGLAETTAGRRYFLLMCGIGLDAEVVRRVEARLAGKRRLGTGWYGLLGARAVARTSPTGTTLTVDGVGLDRPLLQAVIGNTRLYGGVMRLTSAARMDDGLLDVCVLSGRGALHRGTLLSRAVRGGLHRRTGGGIDYARARRVEVRSDSPLSVQADGEYIGETPVTVTVVPRALTVLLPRRQNVLLGGL